MDDIKSILGEIKVEYRHIFEDIYKQNLKLVRENKELKKKIKMFKIKLKNEKSNDIPSLRKGRV